MGDGRLQWCAKDYHRVLELFPHPVSLILRTLYFVVVCDSGVDLVSYPIWHWAVPYDDYADVVTLSSGCHITRGHPALKDNKWFKSEALCAPMRSFAVMRWSWLSVGVCCSYLSGASAHELSIFSCYQVLVGRSAIPHRQHLPVGVHC